MKIDIKTCGEPTEQCPNCGCWYPAGECCHTSSISTSWGGSTLYGVCRPCAELHGRGQEAKE